MTQGLFSGAQFVTSVNEIQALPRFSAEVAFAGRSNAGKSSVINTLCRKNRLAYVSKSPGRTQLINYFQLRNQGYLVDLPGYGYAAVPLAVRTHWVKLLGNYLAYHPNLLGLILIMDSRHPLKPLDQTMLSFFSPRGLPIHVLLSKADKLSRQQQQKTLTEVKKALLPWQKNGATISVQLFSSLKKTGVQEVEEIVGTWFKNFPNGRLDVK